MNYSLINHNRSTKFTKCHCDKKHLTKLLAMLSCFGNTLLLYIGTNTLNLFSAYSLILSRCFEN